MSSGGGCGTRNGGVNILFVRNIQQQRIHIVKNKSLDYFYIEDTLIDLSVFLLKNEKLDSKNLDRIVLISYYKKNIFKIAYL